MSSKPSAVVISIASREPDAIIKLILGADDLPEPTILGEQIPAYPWHIDTKYYVADINLCALTKKTIGNKEFAQSVGATVIYFDSEKEDALTSVESWLPFVKEFSPEVQILLCERCLETPAQGPGRMDVQLWCVENSFELVELNPEPCSEDEEEEEALPGLAVTTGVRRVIQALHAHLWPNLVMKDESQRGQPKFSAAMLDLLNGGINPSVAQLTENTPSESQGGGDQASGETNHTPSHESLAHRIDELLLGCEEGEGLENSAEAEFGALLAQMVEVKAQVATMPDQQRLAAAEQLVKAFWRAIGGDEEEIAGLGENCEPPSDEKTSEQ